MPAVEVTGLVVRYAKVRAVDGVDLAVDAGEVVALLGPNGAGKTSTIEVLEGYRRATSGRVRVLGLDPVGDHRALTARIGVMLQRGGVYPAMSPAEALGLFASYYPRPEDPDALLRQVGLVDASRTPWRRLSGGQQQRLGLALALVGRPDVAFLDEPTAGVDPEGRLAIRQVIAALRDRGVAVLMTTHELDEAERLADRVVIVDHGRVVADGTPAELRATGGGPTIRFGAPAGLDTAALAVAVSAAVKEERPGEYTVEVADGSQAAAIAALTAWLAAEDLPLADLRAGRERLEDVYLRLTLLCPDAPVRGGLFTGALFPGGRRVPAVTALRSQTAAEVRLTLRRGESVLLTLGIPVGLLVFFSLVNVLPEPAGTRHPVDFLTPGILALAVMSTGMVSLGIATGFERQYGVLKRLGSTPLGRPALLAAKTGSIVVVEAVQVIVLVVVALLLGWRPSGDPGLAVAAVLLATVAFSGIGLLMAGALRAEVTLAAANGLYLVLLLLGGMIFPLAKLPGGLRDVAEALPAAALSQVLHGTLTHGIVTHSAAHAAAVPARAWIVLAVWAVVAPVAAALTFRWE